MMLAISVLKGFAIEASDGRIGTVSDFLFDDATWQIRWMVVNTGSWLNARKLLLHPSAIEKPDYRREEVTVSLTKSQVEESPTTFTDECVSQRMETELYGYYGWDPLWGNENYFGAYPYGMGLGNAPMPYLRDGDLLDASRPSSAIHGDPHLRSVTAVTDYHIQAKDGAIGHLKDILVNDATWDIRYLLVDTRNWWPGRHVLLSPYAVRAFSWAERDIELDVTRDQVKGSPPWDPAAVINRCYQERLHGHYGWPAYGW